MKHTYRHRLEIILDTLKIDYRKEPNPGVSVLCVTNLVKNAQQIIKNFLKQSYATKELVLVLTNDEIKLNKFKEQISRYKNINVLQLQENTSYSDALEYGISKTNYPYISVFKDSDYYAPNFLLDMVQAFNYTEAGIVGKNTYYAYLNNNKALALINPKKENQYTDTLSNTALLIKKDVFNGLNLGEILLTGNLFSFCHKNNIKLYSADRFNYLSTTYNSTEEIVSNYQIISPDRKLAAYVTV